MAAETHSAVASDLPAHRSGAKKLEFDSTVYGASEVKQALLAMQADKCCFCESKITHIAYGDVEHFRPKAGWRQNSGDPLTRPGYYWLAYEWSNLLLCCQLCNQRFKGNLFPLRDSALRAVAPGDDLAKEEPLFINPSVENPEALIGFRGEMPYPINGDPRAERTISDLGLDRETLRERRLERLEMLRWAHKIALGEISASDDDRDEAAALLQTFSRPDAEYSAAVKAAIADGFQYV
jgi:uncharacterized protein (TIGR02646 family)